MDVSTVEIIFLSGVVIRYGHRGPWRYLGSRGGRYVKKELKSARREREREREEGLVRKRPWRVENKRNTRRRKKGRKNEGERKRGEE